VSLTSDQPTPTGDVRVSVATPPVFVVVLNWNAEGDTAACLDSFLGQNGARVEILLVDNASADGSGERLQRRYPGVSYLQTGRNLGYCGGNNQGISWAIAQGAEWVLVVNNDTVAAPDCVRLLLDSASSDERLAAVGPLIVRHDDPSRVWFAGGRLARARGIGVHRDEDALVERVAHDVSVPGAPRWRACTFLTGCCLLLRVDALREVGLFREDFFAYGEDVELSIRLARAGWRIAWVPSARLAHRVPPRGAPPTPTQIRLRDRNRRRVVRMHFSPAWRLVFALWFWPSRIVHLARYALTGDRERAAAIVAGMRER
jgi:GT2 family glycosyltransferase